MSGLELFYPSLTLSIRRLYFLFRSASDSAEGTMSLLLLCHPLTLYTYSCLYSPYARSSFILALVSDAYLG